MFGYGGLGMMGGWGWMALEFFGFFVLVGVIFWAVRFLPPWGKGTHKESAMEILQKRYARGEITSEQYVEMKKDLT